MTHTESALWTPPAPRALPALRRTLVEHMDSEPAVETMASTIQRGKHFLSTDIRDPRAAAQWVTEMESDRLRRATLWSVDASMTDVALAAVRKFPTFELRSEEMPSRFGLMVFDKPLHNALIQESPTTEDYYSAIVAASWGVVELPGDGTGTWMTFWAAVQHEQVIEWLQRRHGMSRSHAERLHYGSSADLAPCSDVWYAHDVVDPIQASQLTPGGSGSLAQVVRAAWAMCMARSERRIAEVVQVPSPGPERRQAERGGYDNTGHVNVVRVHPRVRDRARRTHGTDSSGTGHKIDYRKYVSEHTRWQPYPSRNTHELIVINEYVQGPEGAPFKHRKEKVHRLDRKSQVPQD